MIRSRGARIAGFSAAVAATAALIAFGVSSTGAYFTDSQPGTMSGGFGTVQVSGSGLSVNFSGLLPGQFQKRTINYTNATGTGSEDIWLVFPAGKAPALNAPAASGPIPLGRYGHFAITAPAGSFTSYNLASDPNSSSSSSDSCPVNVYGHGGSARQAADASDTFDYCPVPNAILLSKGLTPGSSASAQITFGPTKIFSDDGAQGLSGPIATFKIVATQPGILPSDPNNPPGTMN